MLIFIGTFAIKAFYLFSSPPLFLLFLFSFFSSSCFLFLLLPPPLFSFLLPLLLLLHLPLFSFLAPLLPVLLLHLLPLFSFLTPLFFFDIFFFLLSSQNATLYLRRHYITTFKTCLHLSQYLGFIVVGTGTVFNIIFHVGTKEPPSQALIKWKQEKKEKKLQKEKSEMKCKKLSSICLENVVKEAETVKT